MNTGFFGLLTTSRARQTPASATPNIVADFWQTMEFDTVDSSNLAANDNNAGGTWTVTDGSSLLSTSTTGQTTNTSTVNSVADTGTRGLARSVNNTATAQAKYTFAAAKSNFSVRFYIKTAVLDSFNAGFKIFTWSDDPLSAEHYLQQMRNQGTGEAEIAVVSSGASGNIDITEGTVYRVEINMVKNGDSTFKLYNTSDTQVGTTITWTGYNADTELIILFGSHAGTATASTAYIDNVLIDWTDSTSPLGP